MDTYIKTAGLTRTKDETTRALRASLRRAGIRSTSSARGRAAFERGATAQLMGIRVSPRSSGQGRA